MPRSSSNLKPLGFIVIRKSDRVCDDYSDGEVVRKMAWYRAISVAHASIIAGSRPEDGDQDSIAEQYEVVPIYADAATVASNLPGPQQD